MKRSSGVLMHISSLPSPYGIGTMGKEAYRFVDFLSRARQSYWQILPINPTGFGDSPYQSASTFAGNPYLIDPDMLVEEGLLLEEELIGSWGENPRKVDFGLMYSRRYAMLEKAFSRFDRQAMETFSQQKDWLSTWVLYSALKDHFHGAPWYSWPEDIRDRKPEAIVYYQNLLQDRISFHSFVQYIFDKQWNALQNYAASKNIRFIGDIPIYVPHDSADAWENRQLFQLDEKGYPYKVAGVPPDYFAELGQLWGNPVYRWEEHRQNGFAWWIKRVKAAAERFELIRIDHFRGLESYWAVPYGAPDARPGQWLPGPGMELIRALKEAGLGHRIIAEDLGFLTPEVKKLLSDSGYPGMRVMGFGFDPMGDSRELPHNYVPNSVVYLGTHDSDTIMGWFYSAPAECAAFAVDYLGLNQLEGFPFGFVRGLFTSVSNLAIVQLQDLLGLGSEHRMNLPGTTGWWGWRSLPGEYNDALADRLSYYTRMSARAK